MRKQAGLSLIELMIAITLGLVLMAGVIQVFISSRVTFATQQAVSRVQETGRLAIEFMSRDIRMSGYMGCVSRDGAFADLSGGIAGLHRDFEKGLEGFSTLPSGISLTPAPAVGSDILVVRTADKMPLLAAGPNDTNSFSATVTSSAINNNCSNGICVGSAVSVSDCIESRVITVSGLTAVNTTTLRVSGGPIPQDQFTTGSELVPVSTYVYFVAPSTANNNRLSLWQNINGSFTQELLEGVERLSLTYGRNGSSGYVSASSSLDWSLVNSVRIEMLVASTDDGVLSEAQKYIFSGTEITATDRRLRQVFVNTIAVRSNLE